MDIIGIIIQLVAGAIGGNAAGKISKGSVSAALAIPSPAPSAV